jgi:hypothetical protein
MEKKWINESSDGKSNRDPLGYCRQCNMVLHVCRVKKPLQVYQLQEFKHLQTCFEIAQSEIGMDYGNKRATSNSLGAKNNPKLPAYYSLKTGYTVYRNLRTR